MEEKKEEPKEEPKQETTEEPKPTGMVTVDSANAAADRIEKANLKQEELLKRQEELLARSILGGHAEAGGSKAETKEETPQEYADKVRRGEIDPLK